MDGSRWLGISSLLCFAILSCGGGEAGSAGALGGDPKGPQVQVVDSVLLIEEDTFHVGQPSSLAVDPVDGSFYIADGYSSRAYRFSRDGLPLRSYGRPGDGPGEIRDTRSALPIGDSLVAVDDFRERTLELYDRDTGEFVGRQEHGGISGGQFRYGTNGDTVWLAWPDFPLGTFSVSRWVPRRGELVHLAAAPDVYREHPHYFAASGLTASIAPYRDGFLLGYGSLPRMYVVSGDGTVLDSVKPPVARRRPIPADVVEIMETASEPEKRAAISVLLRMYARSGGDYVLVHSDPVLEGTYPAVEMWARYYVGLLSGDLDRACVDTPLDLGTRAHAIFMARGDTLFVLTQNVVDGTDDDTDPRAETWVRAMLIDEAACDWVPTRP